MQFQNTAAQQANAAKWEARVMAAPTRYAPAVEPMRRNEEQALPTGLRYTEFNENLYAPQIDSMGFDGFPDHANSDFASAAPPRSCPSFHADDNYRAMY